MCHPEVIDIFGAGDHQQMSVTSGRHKDYLYQICVGPFETETEQKGRTYPSAIAPGYQSKGWDNRHE